MTHPSAQAIQRQSGQRWREWYDQQHESPNARRSDAPWCDWFPSIVPPEASERDRDVEPRLWARST